MKKIHFVKASQYTDQERQDLDITAHVEIPLIDPKPTKKRLPACPMCPKGLLMKDFWTGIYSCQRCNYQYNPADLRRRIFNTFLENRR